MKKTLLLVVAAAAIALGAGQVEAKKTWLLL